MTLVFRLLLGVYSVGLECVVWMVLAPAMLIRMARRRATVEELRQRLWGASGTVARCVLVHGVSAGEMAAAEPLVARLGRSGRAVLLSTGTRAGVVAAERLAAVHPHVKGWTYLPWDRRAVRAWLRSVAPQAVVVMETEIWPNVFAACGALGIPLFIANGRVRSPDVPRYRLARGFFRHVLACTAWIGAQSARDRDAFVAMGAPADHVEVTGNLKFDTMSVLQPLPPALTSERVGALIVAGSTHDPEEAWLFECVDRLRRNGRSVRLAVAPRDIGRAENVARLARLRSLRTITWSTWRRDRAQTSSSWDVLVVDEYGWLSSMYQQADVVFVGGTLAPVGGHNVIEAARLGRPVMVGPYVNEVEAIVERLDAGGGIIRLDAVDPVSSLMTTCTALLSDGERARAIGSAARDVCRRHVGAADSTWTAIAERLAW